MLFSSITYSGLCYLCVWWIGSGERITGKEVGQHQQLGVGSDLKVNDHFQNCLSFNAFELLYYVLN